MTNSDESEVAHEKGSLGTLNSHVKAIIVTNGASEILYAW